MRGSIEIRLLAEPTRFGMIDRGRFRVGLVATNNGPDAADPQLYAAHLLVNGERSTAFDLAAGNGVVPSGWDVLRAGGTTPTVEYPLGEALFPTPGEYRLELVLDGRTPAETARTVVVVTP